mmetsp:Transcript_13022/g.32956  ORF Transcript_13022/g.32956 Transcript_13022/m.32956 type:complete len:343 (-) Transcript_13022:452-1480(-)
MKYKRPDLVDFKHVREGALQSLMSVVRWILGRRTAVSTVPARSADSVDEVAALPGSSNVPNHEGDQAVVDFLCGEAAVREREDARIGVQRLARVPQGLLPVHIQRHSREAARLLQLLLQSLAVDDRASRKIDEECSRLHHCQLLPPDQPTRGIAQWAVDADKVACAQEALQLGAWAGGADALDCHREGARHGRQSATDVTHADDSKLLAGHLHANCRPRQAVLERPHLRRQPLCHCHHRAHNTFGHTLRAHSSTDAHRDSPGFAGFDVNVLIACRGLRHQPESGRRVENLGSDMGRGWHQDGSIGHLLPQRQCRLRHPQVAPFWQLLAKPARHNRLQRENRK